ncbi:MAG: hypothetical protein Q9160_003649 [Pyrenula sp. 1 TL-2023]
MRTSTLSFCLLASLPLSLSATTEPQSGHWNWGAYRTTSDDAKAGNFITLSTIDTTDPNLYHNPPPSGPPTCIKISDTIRAQMIVKLGGSAQGGCSPFDQVVPFKTADCTGDVVKTAAKKVAGGSSGQLDAVRTKWPNDHDHSIGWLSFQVKPCANTNAKEKRSTECPNGMELDHRGRCVKEEQNSEETKRSTECPKGMELDHRGRCVEEDAKGEDAKRSTECPRGMELDNRGRCVHEVRKGE